MTKTEIIINEYKERILTSFANTGIKVFFDDNPPTWFDLEKMESDNIPYVIIALSIK